MIFYATQRVTFYHSTTLKTIENKQTKLINLLKPIIVILKL